MRLVAGDRPADRARGDPAEHVRDPVVDDGEHRQPERLAGPRRHQPDRRRHQDAVRRARDERQLGLLDQVRDRVARVVDRPQLGTEALDGGVELGLGGRRVRGAELARHDGRLCDVLVVARLVEGAGAVLPVGEQEALDLGDVHPLQQVGVVRVVRRPVGHRAVDPVVDRAHHVDGLLGVLGGAEGGDREEAAGAGQPTPHVAAVAGVLGDRGHRLRLHRLQQHRPDAPDEHRRVAVHDRDRAALGEPSRAGRAVDPLAVPGPVGAGHAQEQRLPESFADPHPDRAYGPAASASRSPPLTRRSTSDSRSGVPRNSSMPASDRVRASSSRAASHIVRWRCPMWWSWATVSARSAASGDPSGSAGVAVRRVEHAPACRVAPAELEQHHRRARGSGRPARSCRSRSRTGHRRWCGAGCRPTGRGGRSAPAPSGSGSTPPRRGAGSTTSSRSAYGAPAARDALSTAFHSRSPIGASNHSWTGKSERWCTPCSRASSVADSAAGIEPGVGVGEVDPGVDAARPRRRARPRTDRPRRRIGSGDGMPACQQARWNAPPCSASGSSVGGVAAARSPA